MIAGSCLCGSIRFELDAPPLFINHCHCSRCRKAAGAAFGSFLHADGRGFRWVSGETDVVMYDCARFASRAFCRICGSSVLVLEDEGAHAIVPAGCLDDDPGVRPAMHYHVASKAPWFEITDGVPEFAEYPPEDFWASLGL